MNALTKFARGQFPTAVMKAEEAAAYLAVNKMTLYRLVWAGNLPAAKVGRAMRFRVEDLDRFLEEHTTRGGTPITEMPGSPALSAQKAADYLGIGRGTLYRLINAGELVGVKVGRGWRFTKDSLDGYLEASKVHGKDNPQAPKPEEE